MGAYCCFSAGVGNWNIEISGMTMKNGPLAGTPPMAALHSFTSWLLDGLDSDRAVSDDRPPSP